MPKSAGRCLLVVQPRAPLCGARLARGHPLNSGDEGDEEDEADRVDVCENTEWRLPHTEPFRLDPRAQAVGVSPPSRRMPG